MKSSTKFRWFVWRTGLIGLVVTLASWNSGKYSATPSGGIPNVVVGSKVLNASVSSSTPSGIISLANVSFRGCSGCGVSFVGVVPGSPFQVVLETNAKVNSASVNASGNGAVVDVGATGKSFVILTLEGGDYKNWMVPIRITKDEDPHSNEELIIQAGTG